MRKILLFYVVVIALVSAAQNPGVRPFDDEAIRDMLEGFAVMEDDNEDDPRQKDSLTVADYYRMMEKRCEEAGVDKRRILDVAKEEIDRCAAYVKSTGRTSSAHHAVRLLQLVAHSGDRSFLPYLEEKSLDPEIRRSIRSAAAEVYVNIADVEECIEFMRKAFGINADKGFWRFSVSRQFLAKIGAAFDADETSDAIKQRALLILLEYMQAPANPSEASKIDEFLAQKCEGYRQSWQRMDVAQRFLGGENEKVDKHYRLIHESVTQFPPEQRIDLRKRFPDLPPLPDDAPARSPVKVALAIIAGVVALAVCAVAAWLAVRRRRVRKAV